LSDDDDLLTSGLVDSLGMMSLVAFIEEQFGVAVPPEDVTLETFSTSLRSRPTWRRARSKERRVTGRSKTLEQGLPAREAGTDDGSSQLTAIQAAIWAGQRLSPEAPLCNMVLTFTIDRPLDSDGFRRAFGRLVSGRDALRPRIVERDGVPRP